jgi:hypothetical protein
LFGVTAGKPQALAAIWLFQGVINGVVEPVVEAENDIIIRLGTNCEQREYRVL